MAYPPSLPIPCCARKRKTRVILGHVERRQQYPPWTVLRFPFVYDRQDLTLLEFTPLLEIKTVIPLARIRLVNKLVSILLR